ncbi:MAG: DNA polymerase III subunit beta [Thermodesulfobacteriota bacterium]
MELSVRRSDFLYQLTPIQSIAGKKVTVAILGNVLLEAAPGRLALAATDLEIGFRTDLEAQVKTEGSITLPAKKLFEIVREAEAETVQLRELENHWVEITAGTGLYTLAGLPSEDFPAFPPYDEVPLVAFPAPVLKDLIDRTIFSIAQASEGRFTFTAALLEREVKADGEYLRMVSSDSHRLSMMERRIEGSLGDLTFDRNILIPRRAITELAKICESRTGDLQFGFDDKQAVVRVENGVMVIRLMVGEFPRYRDLLAAITLDKPLEIDRLRFLGTLRRINLLTEDQNHVVNFRIEGQRLFLSSRSVDLGSARDEIMLRSQGDDMQVGFNCRYFIDVLQVLQGETIKAYLNSDESPCLVRTDEDEGFAGIIMPMKV